jgi:pimeloyl-ACP methyl ester carboxylesterase
MKKQFLGSLLFSGLCMLAALPGAQAEAVGPIGKVCHLPGHDDILRCLTVDVPRDYAHPAKGSIKLHVAIAGAVRAGVKNDPLFVLAGGPGQSGSSIAWTLDTGFRRARATRDIVLIDQRGTGKSGKLTCPELESSETLDPVQQEKETAACLASLKVDFNDYSTEAAARDIERVRLALHHQQINLWGGSYGTRLAQEYARLFPASVRSMVIDGVVSPLQNVADLSPDIERALGLLRRRCADDPQCKAAFPHFDAQLDALLARAASGNEMLRFAHPVTGEPLVLPLSVNGFGGQLHGSLYQPAIAVRLPWLVMQAAAGNWQPFMANSFSGYNPSDDGISVGLHLAVLCGEDLPYLTPAQMKLDPTITGSGATQRLLRLCPPLHIAPRRRAGTSIIAAPTLLLSGRLDPVTPPGRAEETLKYLSHGQHVIAQHAGHGVTSAGCGGKLLRQFLDAPDQKIDAKCLSELPAAPFVLSGAGAAP